MVCVLLLRWHGSCLFERLAGLQSSSLIMKKSLAAMVTVWLLTVGAGFGMAAPVGSEDLKFDVLQIGSHTYRNVTVTTRSKSYIYILHAEGMTNIKVSELPADCLQKLGYAETQPKKAVVEGVAASARQTLAKLETAPQVKALEQQLTLTLSSYAAMSNLRLPPLTAGLLLSVAGGLMAVYLFYCYCCLLICRKAGEKAGVLVWVPILQLVPMLRAARMPGWWFFMFFVPVVNLVGHVSLCLKLAQARGKSLGVGLLLVLPAIGGLLLVAIPSRFLALWYLELSVFVASLFFLSLLGFLYLAFSHGPAAQPIKAPKHTEIMTLETA